MSGTNFPDIIEQVAQNDCKDAGGRILPGRLQDVGGRTAPGASSRANIEQWTCMEHLPRIFKTPTWT